MAMPDSTHSYVGWLRRSPIRGRRRWEAVCSAPTEHECARLLDLTPRSGNVDLVVLAAGEDPDAVLGGSQANKAPPWRRTPISPPRAARGTIPPGDVRPRRSAGRR